MPRSASQHGSQMGRFDDLDLSRQRAHVVGHGSVARMSGAHAHTHSARVLSMKRSNGDGWTIVAVWLRSVLDWLRVVTTASPRRPHRSIDERTKLSIALFNQTWSRLRVEAMMHARVCWRFVRRRID